MRESQKFIFEKRKNYAFSSTVFSEIIFIFDFYFKLKFSQWKAGLKGLCSD